MNRNVKLFNAVKLKDLGLSNNMISFIKDQTQDDNEHYITKSWVADTIGLMKDLKGDSPETFDKAIMDELSELAQLMINKRIMVVIL